jgi:CheY-like chemotaxis protein
MATVLIVDDSAVDRKIAGACIEEEGLKPMYAESGRQALDIIPQKQPDIVLTDVSMPEMNGLELVEHIRRFHRPLPVIIMTAYGSEETAVAALKAGATSYVPKKGLRKGLSSALPIVLSAVEARKHREKVRGLLEMSESHFVIGMEPDAPAALVRYLENDLAELNFCDDTGLFQVNSALSEAIANAVEHGSLELDSELREAHDGSYYHLGHERRKRAPYRDRRVYVSATLNQNEATYVVRDEGPGFDTSSLPNPKDPENLVKAGGRGILLIRMFMDAVRFDETGNQITMVKRRPSCR